MRKSKIKEAIKFSLHHYYKNGLTNTAAKFRKELIERVSQKIKSKN